MRERAAQSNRIQRKGYDWTICVRVNLSELACAFILAPPDFPLRGYHTACLLGMINRGVQSAGTLFDEVMLGAKLWNGSLSLLLSWFDVRASNEGRA